MITSNGGTPLRVKTWQADTLLLLVTAIWGITFPVVKNATLPSEGGVPTYWFLAARFTLAAVLLTTFTWRRARAAPPRTWAAGALIGSFLFAGYAFQTFGLGLTTASQAGLITGLSVVLVPVIAVFWLKRPPTLGAWMGVVLATFGLALLSLNGTLLPTPGDLLLLFCALSFALHIASVARYAGPHDPVALSVIQIACAALLAWLFHLAGAGTLAPGAAGVQWWGAPGMVVGAILICGIFATAVAFLLQNVLQPFTTPTHTALIFSAEPVFAALFAWMLLGEALTLRGYVGGAFILAGMLLAELAGRTAETAGQAAGPRAS
jgi:drug/metabolite transporter (DMT)-like permease